MIFCVDIGNSNIVYGCYDGDKPMFISRAATDSRRMSDQYAAELHSLFELHAIDPSCVTDAVMSSVVPGVTEAIVQALRRVLHVEPYVISAASYDGLEIKIDNPKELGCDLLATAVGAKEKYKKPCVIVDMGTATKMTVLDKNGAFLGGAIMPGLRVSTEALVEKTSLLPGVSYYAPASPIGKNTPDCMMAGSVIGTAAMLDGMYDRICAELGEKATVVITGGLAVIAAPQCKTEMIYDETLLLDGLRHILAARKK